MWDFKQVRNVEYRGEYVYHILFDGAVEGDLDFSEYLSKEPILAALKDTSLFAKATWKAGPSPGSMGPTWPQRPYTRRYFAPTNRSSAKRRAVERSDGWWPALLRPAQDLR
jgi:hypothetical protein